MEGKGWRALLAAALAGLLLTGAAVARGKGNFLPAETERWMAVACDEAGVPQWRRPLARHRSPAFPPRGEGWRVTLIPLPEYNQSL